MFNFYAGRSGRTFEANYRVYPVSFIDKNDAENGDKIFLPPSALDRLGMTHSKYMYVDVLRMCFIKRSFTRPVCTVCPLTAFTWLLRRIDYVLHFCH